jgi:hypothetical protein
MDDARSPESADGEKRQAPLPLPEDPVEVLIPYRNPYALTSYYLGVFALIPCVGLFLAIGAVVFGIVGLKVAAKQPTARGKVHAWVGIVLGTLILLAYAVFLLLGVIAALGAYFAHHT